MVVPDGVWPDTRRRIEVVKIKFMGSAPCQYIIIELDIFYTRGLGKC